MSTRVKTSTVLKYAYNRIKDGRDEYICFAVENFERPFVLGVADYAEDTASEVRRTLRLIQTRMQMKRFEKWVSKQQNCWYDDPYSYCEASLNWWLVWKGYVKADNMPDSKAMTEYRLAWLTAMIEEFEAKGD